MVNMLNYVPIVREWAYVEDRHYNCPWLCQSWSVLGLVTGWSL